MLPQSIRDVRVPDLSGVCMQLPKINTWHPNPTPPLPFYLSLTCSLSLSTQSRATAFDFLVLCMFFLLTCLFLISFFFLSFAVGAHFLHFCSMWITVLASGRAIRKRGGRRGEDARHVTWQHLIDSVKCKKEEADRHLGACYPSFR